MKRFFKFTSAALAVAALASCSSDDLLETSVKPGLGGAAESDINVTLESLTDMETTRAAFDPTNGNALYWSDGDQIWVFDAVTCLKYDMYDYKDGAFVLDPSRNGVPNLNGKDALSTPAYAMFGHSKNRGDYGWEYETNTITAKYYIPSNWAWSEVEVAEGTVQAYQSQLPMWGRVSDAEKMNVSMFYVTSVLRVDLDHVPGNADYIIVEAYDDKEQNVKSKLASKSDSEGAFQLTVNPELTTDEEIRAGLNAIEPIEGQEYTNQIVVNVTKAVRENSSLYIPIIPGTYGSFRVAYSNNAVPSGPIASADGVKPPYTLIYSNYNSKTGTTPITFTRAKVKPLGYAFSFAGTTVSSVNAELAKAEKKSVKAVGDEGTLATADDNTLILPETEDKTVSVDLQELHWDPSGTGVLNVVADGDYTGKTVKLTIAKTSNISQINVNIPGATVVLDGELSCQLGDAAGNPINVKALTVNGTCGNVYTGSEVQTVTVGAAADVNELVIPANSTMTKLTVNGHVGTLNTTSMELVKGGVREFTFVPGDGSSFDDLTLYAVKDGFSFKNSTVTKITVKPTQSITGCDLTYEGGATGKTFGEINVSDLASCNITATKVKAIGTISAGVKGNISIEGIATSGNDISNVTGDLTATGTITVKTMNSIETVSAKGKVVVENVNSAKQIVSTDADVEFTGNNAAAESAGTSVNQISAKTKATIDGNVNGANNTTVAAATLEVKGKARIKSATLTGTEATVALTAQVAEQAVGTLKFNNNTENTLTLSSGRIGTVEGGKNLTVVNEETLPTAINSISEGLLKDIYTSKWCGTALAANVVTADFQNAEIYTASQLANVAGNIDVTLEADMDMDSKNFTALPALTAEFNGNKMTIKNLTLTAQTGGTTLGLFASLGNGAKVHDLKIEEVIATADGLTGGMGFLAGAASGATITVEGVEIVGGNNQIGGLNAENVGGLIGLISGSSTVNITGKSTPAMKEAFSSSNNSFIAIKKVSGKAYLGGVVGRITSSKPVVIKGYCLPNLAKFELAGTPTKVQYGTVGSYVGTVDNSSADVKIVDENDKATHLTTSTAVTTTKPTTDYWNPQTTACLIAAEKTALMFNSNFQANSSDNNVYGFEGITKNFVGYSPKYSKITWGTTEYNKADVVFAQPGTNQPTYSVNVFSKKL